MLIQAIKKYMKLINFSNANYVKISRNEFFLFKNNVQRSVKDVIPLLLKLTPDIYIFWKVFHAKIA